MDVRLRLIPIKAKMMRSGQGHTAGHKREEIMAVFRCAIAATVLFGTALGASAAEYGDAKAGLAVARQWCATCHVVEEGQATATQMQAPTFESVADTLSDDRKDELVAWLTAPHGPMEVISLSRQQIADVLAYIATLKKP